MNFRFMNFDFRLRSAECGVRIGKPIRLLRVLWIPGLMYAGETVEQMDAREARLRAMDAEIDAAERKAEADRARPWWVEPDLTGGRGGR